MWKNLTKPVVIAHRGDSKFAPENTLGAFKQAMDKGAQAIEFDVKLSSDRKVVVIHDQTVDRTTNGHGDIRYLSMEEIKRLDAGVRFAEKFPSERIPTLEEVFQNLGTGIHMNIELTNYATPHDGLVEEVVRLIKKFGNEDQLIFSSFFARNLHLAKKLIPTVPCGLLAYPGLVGLPARGLGWKKDMDALHPYLSDVHMNLVKRVHDAGRQLNVWTVNLKEDLERLIKMGVDGIFTDDPFLLNQLCGKVP